MCTVMDLPTSILAFLFAPLMLTGLPNHFPLLTMVSASCLARLALIANILPDKSIPNINTTLFNIDSGRSKYVLEFTLILEKVNVVP